MTTSDNGAGIIEAPRSLDALLNSKTYQGMTDAEIQAIIDYWKDYKYTEGYQAARYDNAADEAAAMQSFWQKQASEAEAAFNAAVTSAIRFQEV